MIVFVIDLNPWGLDKFPMSQERHFQPLCTLTFWQEVYFLIKVGSWGDKSKNSWMSWSEHKTIFNLIYVNFFDKICTLNIIYMSYRWKIGKNFAQKMIINTKTDKTSCQGYQKNKESKVVKWLQIYLPSIKTTLINHFFLIGTDPLWFQCNEFIRNIIVDWFFFL